MCDSCEVHPGGGVMDRIEILLWWDAIQEVHMDYVPFSDSEGQMFWLEWDKVLLEALGALTVAAS